MKKSLYLFHFVDVQLNGWVISNNSWKSTMLCEFFGLCRSKRRLSVFMWRSSFVATTNISPVLVGWLVLRKLRGNSIHFVYLGIVLSYFIVTHFGGAQTLYTNNSSVHGNYSSMTWCAPGDFFSRSPRTSFPLSLPELYRKIGLSLNRMCHLARKEINKDLECIISRPVWK